MILRAALRPLRASSTPRTQILRKSLLPRAPTGPRTFPLQHRIASAAWYSSTSSNSATNGSSPSTSDSTSQSSDTNKADDQQQEDPLRKELEAKTREVIDLKDKYLRSVADFRNLQDRTAREISAAKSFAIQRFAKDLIDSIDNLDRALSIIPPEKLVPVDDPTSPARDLVNLHDGLKMTETILMQTLKKHGLERFDPLEEKDTKFDPNLHEATFQAPVPGKEDGTVMHTMQKGFVLNGRVLRAAKVGLVKNPPSSESHSAPPPGAGADPQANADPAMNPTPS
ncbi:MAG: hypothetical protein M1823_002208 [Watsoniomyces obsoletus]|nr:MAG: hypothetical protein M1823_002208 [Watsoniomyces obsoletus]